MFRGNIGVGFILFLARIANVDKSGPQVLIYFYVDSFLPVITQIKNIQRSILLNKYSSTGVKKMVYECAYDNICN